MESIKEHSDLIKLIPVNNQSTIIKKKVWGKYSDYEEKINALFGKKDTVEFSRKDVFLTNGM